MSNDYNGMKRSELPDSVFGIPQERKYPMPDEKHTRSAIKLFNHVDPKHEEQLAKAVIKNMKKYGIDGSAVGPNNRLRKYLPKDMLKESSIEEGFLKSDKDIYYNKDKFDSGEINLCFITGLSGSGKSTMGRNMSSKNIEHYEMDDVICNDNFSDDNLKEYGGLISSFFKGSGKSFRLIQDDDKHNDSVFNTHKNYEKEITQAFVKHAISYCKSHKGIKYVCDGIWIFMFIKPEQLKDCAVYIKGTSSIKSGYRALKRDNNEDKRNGMTSLQIFKHEFKRVKEDILYARENQKELKSFRSYFEKQLTNESSSILPQDTGISTVIFDIGDVLVSANIKDYLMADPEIPNEIVDELLKLWFIDKDEVDDTMDLDTYREIVNKRMGVEFSNYIPKLFQYNVECVTAFDYTIPMIQDLKDKGYKVYYLSNWSAWTHDLLQEAGKFDFLNLMDGGVFSYDVGYMKPDEEIYKILINKYKINPEEAIFFDDREENIEAANKLGIHGVHFPRHDSSIVYNSLKVMQISHEIFNMSYSFNPCDMPEFITFSPKPALETVCIDIESILGASVTQDDDGSVKVKSYNKRYYDYDTIAQSFMEAAKREDFPISIKNGNDRFEYTPPTKEKSYGEVGGVSMSKGGFTEETIQEYGTTGGTIVGSNQPDSVYIVNYMQNNVFSGHKEKKRAICKKGMNQMYTTQDGHTVPVDIDDFKENASEITVFKLKEQPLIPYDNIIELANFDNEFYTLLTGDIALDVDSILATDSRFVQEENFFDELDAIKACTESTILGESETTKYPYIKVLTESEYGRPWNYYRDINGVFAMNEITGLRSRSYEDISDIPKPELDLVKRGTVYGVTE